MQQDFESLLEKSYGKRTGNDQPLMEMIKRDLFVQELIYKLQEKVLPSASTFADALHQPHLVKKQHMQLAKLYKYPSSDNS